MNQESLPTNIVLINGPNLNLLGKREPEIYGKQSFEEYLAVLQKDFPQVHFEYFQSNHEGALVDKIQEVGFSCDGIVLNAAAYTHTSIALHDAIKAVRVPVIEVHLSDIYQREAFRRVSMIQAACKNSFIGFGMESYRKAVEYLLSNR